MPFADQRQLSLCQVPVGDNCEMAEIGAVLLVPSFLSLHFKSPITQRTPLLLELVQLARPHGMVFVAIYYDAHHLGLYDESRCPPLRQSHLTEQYPQGPLDGGESVPEEKPRRYLHAFVLRRTEYVYGPDVLMRQPVPEEFLLFSCAPFVQMEEVDMQNIVLTIAGRPG